MDDRDLTMTRRRLMGTATALAATASTTVARAEPGALARGSVFEDADGSPLRPANARGIAGVMVSNGREVVITDEDGRYRIAVTTGGSVFVIKPSGWISPLAAQTRLPRFSYLHQPRGTPGALNLRYAGVAPTGPLPGAIDFPLRRQAEPDRFTAFLLTDPQPEDARELDFVRDDVIAQLPQAADAAFGITLGDLMFDDLSLYARHNRLIGSLGLPWFNLPGNHDMNYEPASDRYSRETWKRVFGPRYHAWNWGPATFFALDNVEYLGGARYTGRFGDDQLAFVAAVLGQLPRERLVIFCMHIPLKTALGGDPHNQVADAEAFLRLVEHRPNAISFAGHTHTNEHWYLGDAGRHHHHVLQAVCGSWWSGPFDARGIPVAVGWDGAPNGFHVLSVDGVHASCRLVPAHDPAQGKMRISLAAGFHSDGPEAIRDSPQPVLNPAPLTASALAGASLLVNLFEGGPKSTVAWRLDAQSFWRPMTRTLTKDPYCAGLYGRNPATTKPWVTAQISTHLWTAPLPADLAPGTHQLTVRGTDEYEVETRAGLVLEVLEGVMETIALSTPRLLLRPWRDDDLPRFAAMNADPQVMAHFVSVRTTAQSDASAARIRAAMARDGYGLWAVEIVGGAPFIGFVGLAHPQFDAAFTPCVEIGWRLAHAYWGLGYATEAARVVLADGFLRVGLDEILSLTTPANRRSRAVMARLGMTQRAADDFDHPEIAPGHPLRRHVVYRLLRADWRPDA